MQPIPPSSSPLGAPQPQDAPPQEGAIEALGSDEAIAVRTSCTLSQVRRLIREGFLKQVSATPTHRFFRSADLNSARALAQRLIDITGIRASADSDAEFFARVAAAESGHSEPTGPEVQEGQRKAKLKRKLDTQVEIGLMRVDDLLSRLDALGRSLVGTRLRLSAVDTRAGVLRGVVVMQAGVALTGKTIFVDENGLPTKDPKAARRRLQVFSDRQTLKTLLAACQDAGNKLRVRVDHDDSVQSRAGFATGFRLDGDVVRADVTLFDAFEGRDLVLETAEKTPSLMGMSVDIVPTFEIADGKAFLRIQEISACDLVDEGAGTPGGFFSE